MLLFDSYRLNYRQISNISRSLGGKIVDPCLSALLQLHSRSTTWLQ